MTIPIVISHTCGLKDPSFMVLLSTLIIPRASTVAWTRRRILTRMCPILLRIIRLIPSARTLPITRIFVWVTSEVSIWTTVTVLWPEIQTPGPLRAIRTFSSLTRIPISSFIYISTFFSVVSLLSSKGPTWTLLWTTLWTLICFSVRTLSFSCVSVGMNVAMLDTTQISLITIIWPEIFPCDHTFVSYTSILISSMKTKSFYIRKTSTIKASSDAYDTIRTVLRPNNPFPYNYV